MSEKMQNNREQDNGQARRLRQGGLNMSFLLAMAVAAATDIMRDIPPLSAQTATPMPRRIAEYPGARHFQTGNLPHDRAQQAGLAGEYNAAATRWRSGAIHSAHRSRENRQAERQRNWAAFQKNG